LKRKDVIVLWREYFDLTIPRKDGRRVTLKEGVPNPSLNELVNACRRLNLNIVEFREARYPRMWWKVSGYVMIKKDGLKKREVLRRVAKELRRLRG
jgi:signal recognition particle subunit SEC65